MERVVLLRLRVAARNDFATSSGERKTGIPFFYKNSTGVIEDKMRFFNDDTDLDNFRALYVNGQIYVFDEMQEPRNYNCIDWELVDKELDYEIEQAKKYNSKTQ